MWWDWLLALGLWTLIIGYAIFNLVMIGLDIRDIIVDGDYFSVFFLGIWDKYGTDFNIVGKIIITLLMVCFLPIVFIIEALIVLITLICLFFNWLFHLKFSNIISFIFQKKTFKKKTTIKPKRYQVDSDVLRVIIKRKDLTDNE